jgi:hypothetical protein
LVPIFATVYFSLPHRSFYDSNAQREQSVYGDAAQLRASLSQAIRRHLGNVDTRIAGVRVAIRRSTIEVSALDYTPEQRLLLEVRGWYGPAERSRGAEGNFAMWVEAAVSGGLFVTQSPGQPQVYGLSVGLSTPGGSANEEPKRSPIAPPVSLLFPPPAPSLPLPDSSAGTLSMSRGTYEELTHFYAAVQGDPSYASGVWLRMLYLSAVTITTLGFGDITPVSESARLCVALEAVLGVVLAGLFLNALAIRVRKRSQAA